MKVMAENTKRSPNVGLLLGHRRRRWPNSKPILAKRLVDELKIGEYAQPANRRSHQKQLSCVNGLSIHDNGTGHRLGNSDNSMLQTENQRKKLTRAKQDKHMLACMQRRGAD